jgi:redox-sensitive bicupin YhaK (pirin superfamily)
MRQEVVMTTTQPIIDVRRADSRFHTDIGWLDSYHSFSFSSHYDPDNVGHGLLIVNNDDRVRAATGFGTHAHQNMEIVTWVLSGEVEHRDSEGNHGIIYPGLAQRMSAGSGIRHSEMNPSPDTDVHFLQMWVLPDTEGIAPGYEQLDISEAIASGNLVPIASGQGHEGAVALHQRDAVLWGARVAEDAMVIVPDAPHVHVFVAVGSGSLVGAGPLDTGDAVRLTEAGEREFTAGPDGAEVLVWATA